MSLRLLTIVAAMCALFVPAGSSADRAGPAMVGDYLSYFNRPLGNEEALTIQNKLLKYIEGATPGSEIRGHITTIGIPEFATALIEAQQRGVSVYLVHDGRFSPNGSAPGKGDRDEGLRLEKHFGTRHKWCYQDQAPVGPDAADPTSCVSSIAKATHHIKNWYFSDTVVDGRRRRFSTWVTSYNLTHTSNRQFNDAFVVNGNHALYRAFVRSFASFYNQDRSDDLYGVAGRGHRVVPSANTEISYAPQQVSDQVAMALSRIDRYGHGCRLKVANLSLAASRKALISQLVRISRLGCQVQVAYSCDYGQAASRLLGGDVEVRTPKSKQVHSKMMVYRGRYDGTPNRTIVWGGSHNLTGPSLRRRDEVFVGISRLGIYKRYRDYFATIWGRSAVVQPWSLPTNCGG